MCLKVRLTEAIDAARRPISFELPAWLLNDLGELLNVQRPYFNLLYTDAPNHLWLLAIKEFQVAGRKLLSPFFMYSGDYIVSRIPKGRWLVVTHPQGVRLQPMTWTFETTTISTDSQPGSVVHQVPCRIMGGLHATPLTAKRLGVDRPILPTWFFPSLDPERRVFRVLVITKPDLILTIDHHSVSAPFWVVPNKEAAHAILHEVAARLKPAWWFDKRAADQVIQWAEARAEHFYSLFWKTARRPRSVESMLRKALKL